jgi:hypothetical protein
MRLEHVHSVHKHLQIQLAIQDGADQSLNRCGIMLDQLLLPLAVSWKVTINKTENVRA